MTVDDGTDTVKYMWDHSSSAALPGLLAQGDVGFVSVDGSTPIAADVPDGQNSGTGQNNHDRVWLVTDPYGTPVTATYGTGHADTGVAIQAPVAPDAYGVGTSDVAGLEFLGLPSQADDMSLLRARSYDTSLGVFTSPDPLNDPTAGVFNLGSPAASSYLYGYGNPASYSDPSGLYPAGGMGLGTWAPKMGGGAGGTCQLGRRTLGTWASGAGAKGCLGARWTEKHMDDVSAYASLLEAAALVSVVGAEAAPVFGIIAISAQAVHTVVTCGQSPDVVCRRSATALGATIGSWGLSTGIMNTVGKGSALADRVLPAWMASNTSFVGLGTVTELIDTTEGPESR